MSEYVIGKEYVYMGNFVKLVDFDESDNEATVKSRFEEHSVIRLSQLREKENRGETKKRLFVRTPGLDETWCHCADSKEEAKATIWNMLEADIDNLFLLGEGFEAEFELREMTDAEVAALPDI